MILNTFLLLMSLFASKLGEATYRPSNKIVRTSAVVQKQKADDYVVLPLSQMLGDDFKDYSAGKLALNDFADIEIQLKSFAEEYNKEDRLRQAEWIKRVPALKYQKMDQSIKLADYKRQYICGVDKKGDKIVWVNCFCKSDINILKYWKRQTVFVMDGGKCFFNLKINLTKKIKYDIMVNGIA